MLFVVYFPSPQASSMMTINIDVHWAQETSAYSCTAEAQGNVQVGR